MKMAANLKFEITYVFKKNLVFAHLWSVS